AVIVDDGFGDLAFTLQKLQAILRVCELAFEGFGVGAACGDALAEIFGLGFQRIARGGRGTRFRLERPARGLRAAQQLILLADTAVQTRDLRPQLTRFLARAAAVNA